MESLNEKILIKITEVCTHVSHMRDEIREIKTDRDRNNDEYWKHINNTKDDVNDLKLEIKGIKTKLTLYVGVVATALSLAINWIWRRL